MKYSAIFLILKSLQENPKLWRKVKTLAVFGLFGVVLIGGMAVWAGLSVIGYLSSSAHQYIQAPVTQSYVENAKTHLQQVHFKTASCWSQSQDLLHLQPWIEHGLSENIRRLKGACFESKGEECLTEECLRMKKFIKTTEGVSV